MAKRVLIVAKAVGRFVASKLLCCPCAAPCEPANANDEFGQTLDLKVSLKVYLGYLDRITVGYKIHQFLATHFDPLDEARGNLLRDIIDLLKIYRCIVKNLNGQHNTTSRFYRIELIEAIAKYEGLNAQEESLLYLEL